MQTGMKAGLAIVLAVFLTGIVGFLTAVVPEDEERTYYDQVSDLTPIVDASAIDSYTEYNPVTNVSGWADATGVTIPFLTSGISAYPYRHYVESDEGSSYTTYLYSSGIMDQNWSSIEAANWYPTAAIHGMSSTSIGNHFTLGGVTVTRDGAGHFTVESDYSDSDSSSFSVFFGHYDGNGSLIHGFTRTYEEWTSGSTDESLTITSLSQFDSTASSLTRMVPPAESMGLAVDIDVNVTLPTGHYLYVGVTVAQDISTTAHSGYWLDLYNGRITAGQQHDSVDGYTVFNGGMDWKSRSYGDANKYVSIDNKIYLDGVLVNTELDAFNVIPFSQLMRDFDMTDQSTMRVNGYPLYHGTTSYTSDFVQVAALEGTFTANLTSVGADKLTYVADDQCWYPSVLSDNGLYYEPDMTEPGYPSDEIFVVVKGWVSQITTFSNYPVYEYKYVDANQFVNVGDGITAKWRNYQDSTVGGKTVTSPYNNGAIVLLTEPGTVISSDKAFYKDTDGNTTQGSFTLTVPTSIPYAMARVVLDFQNNVYYAQGIVWGAIDEDERGTGNWTLRPYQYPITPTFTGLSDVSYVQGISVEKAGGTKVFVLETSVQTDPMGRLWGDPSIYLGYYFPDYFTYDSTTGNTGVPTTAIRMLINGIVSYGTSLTINGQYMPVADGNITFTYYTYETETIPSTDPNVPPTTNTITVTNEGNMPVKGMAIDWEDGHVYLVFTEQGKTRYDLGEYNTTAADVVIAGTDTGKDTVVADIISGTGTWYWQSNLYTINHEIETTLHLDLTQGLSGWGMTLQVSMLLFAGMLIVGVAIVHYYYRDSDEPMGILDWVIIGAAILLCLGVAAI